MNRLATQALEQVSDASASRALRPETRVADLSPAEQQLVEIARVIAEPNCRIVILDEFNGFVANLVGIIALFCNELSVSLPVSDSTAFCGEIIDFSDHIAIERVKAPILWPIFLVSMT